MPVVYYITHFDTREAYPIQFTHVYVGSTSRSLEERFNAHLNTWKTGGKSTTASQIFDMLETKDVIIETYLGVSFRVSSKNKEHMHQASNGDWIPNHVVMCVSVEMFHDDNPVVRLSKEQAAINKFTEGSDYYKFLVASGLKIPIVVNKNKAFRGATTDFSNRSPESFVKYMLYQNGEKDVSVPLSMIDKKRYYNEVSKEKVLAKQKAKSDYCSDCQKSYNQIKVHCVSEKHKKRVAQLALSPIMAKTFVGQ